MEHTSKRWLESTGKRRKSAGTATPFGRVFDEPGLAVDHVVALLADDLALAVFDRGAFVGHDDLLRMTLRSVLAAGLRALDVLRLDEAHLAADSLVQAALATGRGLGVDAVVTGWFPSFFRLRHDITSRCFGSFRYSSLVVSVFRPQGLYTLVSVSSSNRS